MADRPASCRIQGTGSYMPPRILTNHDLEHLVDTSDEWITTRTGIRERRIADPDVASSDLAYEASIRALKAAGIEATDIDVIIVGTVTPDHVFPSCGCTLQARLGARQAAAFDVTAACSGFLYALQVGRSMILAGTAQRVLIVGVEVLSRIIDWSDRSTCVLFGDGAGAVVLTPSDEADRGILSVKIGSDGVQGEVLYLPAGGSRHPATHETVEQHLHFVHMSGNDLFKTAVRGMEMVARQALDEVGIQVSEIDLLVPHQANLRIIDATARRLEVPMEKVVVNIEKYGNTSAASIPIALDEAVRGGRIRPGSTIVMVAFGGGLTWGAAVVKW